MLSMNCDKMAYKLYRWGLFISNKNLAFCWNGRKYCEQLMCFNTSVEMLLYLYVQIKLMVFPKLFSFSLERRLLQHTTSGLIIVAVGCGYNKNIFIWFIFSRFKTVYPHNIYKKLLSWLKNLENITIADSAWLYSHDW